MLILCLIFAQRPRNASDRRSPAGEERKVARGLRHISVLRRGQQLGPGATRARGRGEGRREQVLRPGGHPESRAGARPGRERRRQEEQAEEVLQRLQEGQEEEEEAQEGQVNGGGGGRLLGPPSLEFVDHGTIDVGRSIAQRWGEHTFFCS